MLFNFASGCAYFMVIGLAVQCGDGYRPTYVGGCPRICKLPREHDPNAYEQSEGGSATSDLITIFPKLTLADGHTPEWVEPRIYTRDKGAGLAHW